MARGKRHRLHLSTCMAKGCYWQQLVYGDPQSQRAASQEVALSDPTLVTNPQQRTQHLEPFPRRCSLCKIESLRTLSPTLRAMPRRHARTLPSHSNTRYPFRAPQPPSHPPRSSSLAFTQPRSPAKPSSPHPADTMKFTQLHSSHLASQPPHQYNAAFRLCPTAPLANRGPMRPKHMLLGLLSTTLCLTYWRSFRCSSNRPCLRVLLEASHPPATPCSLLLTEPRLRVLGEAGHRRLEVVVLLVGHVRHQLVQRVVLVRLYGKGAVDIRAYVRGAVWAWARLRWVLTQKGNKNTSLCPSPAQRRPLDAPPTWYS